MVFTCSAAATLFLCANDIGYQREFMYSQIFAASSAIPRPTIASFVYHGPQVTLHRRCNHGHSTLLTWKWSA